MGLFGNTDQGMIPLKIKMSLKRLEQCKQKGDGCQEKCSRLTFLLTALMRMNMQEQSSRDCLPFLLFVSYGGSQKTCSWTRGKVILAAVERADVGLVVI